MPVNKFCGCIDLDCSKCFELTIPYCPSNPINIQVGLTPGQSLYLWMIDKLENIFFDTIIVNGDGSFDINTNNFPQLTNEFGTVNLFLTTDSGGQNRVNMTFNSKIFICLLLTIDEPEYLTDDNCSLLTDEIDEPLIT